MYSAKEIYLSIDQDGRIRVDPYYAVFRVGDSLVWRCAEGTAWTIGFRNSRTPTDKRVIQGHGDEMDGEHVAKKEGHFSYAVAVLGRKRNKLAGKPIIFMDANCPEIIIDSAEN